MADLEPRVKKTEEHIAHIYEMLDRFADNQNKLDEALTTLTEAQISYQQQSRETDRRIGELVSAIGEFIRRSGNGKN